MGIFSRSNTGSSSKSTTTYTKKSEVFRIESVITERENEQYTADPRDTDIPAFTRTGSYYQAGVDDQPEYKFLQASDVRRQVQEAPSRRIGAYPRPYHNQPPQPLQAQRPYREYPMVPSPQNGSHPQNYRQGDRPGPIRAFYNDNDRGTFDVGFHDPKEAPRGPRMGRMHPNTPYSLATYNPAPTFTDTSKLRRS